METCILGQGLGHDKTPRLLFSPYLASLLSSLYHNNYFFPHAYLYTFFLRRLITGWGHLALSFLWAGMNKLWEHGVGGAFLAFVCILVVPFSLTRHRGDERTGATQGRGREEHTQTSCSLGQERRDCAQTASRRNTRLAASALLKHTLPPRRRNIAENLPGHALHGMQNSLDYTFYLPHYTHYPKHGWQAQSWDWGAVHFWTCLPASMEKGIHGIPINLPQPPWELSGH